MLRPGGRLLLFGIHPCFNGPSVENREDGARIIHPSYRESRWHHDAPWWGEAGIRRTVGVRHRPLSELLNDVLNSPLRLSMSPNHGTTPFLPFSRSLRKCLGRDQVQTSSRGGRPYRLCAQPLRHSAGSVASRVGSFAAYRAWVTACGADQALS